MNSRSTTIKKYQCLKRLFFSSCLALSASHVHAQYVFTDIGTNSVQYAAKGINSTGQISTLNGLWNPNSPNSSTGSIVNTTVGITNGGINSTGQISGDGFTWTPNTPNGSTGSFTILQTPSGFDSSNNRSLNDAGYSVGEATTTGFGSQAGRWDSSGNFIALGATSIPGNLTTGFQESKGSVINSYGQVVGYDRTAPAGGPIATSGWLWTPSTANGGTGTYTTIAASAITSGLNNFGQIVIAPGFSLSLLTPNVANGTSFSTTSLGNFKPSGISNKGVIFGRNMSNNPAIWTPNVDFGSTGSFTDLISFIPGATTGRVLGVNDLGQIVGEYDDAGGSFKGFLLTPSSLSGSAPEPTTLSLLTLGALGAVIVRRRKAKRA